jgi:hypothetical protein
MDKTSAGLEYASLKKEDVQAITELEKIISSRAGEDTILLAYNKTDK